MSKDLKISSFCSPYLLTVEGEESLCNVIQIMKDENVRHIPVVKDEVPIGIISERELGVFEGREFAEKFSASDIMIKDPFVVSEVTDLRDVVEIMINNKYGSCLVKGESGKISGIFTMIDVLRTLKILLSQSGGEEKTLRL